MRGVSSLAQKLAVILAALTGPMLPSTAVGQDMARIQIVPNIPHSLGIHSVAVSPDGKRLVSGGSDKSIKLWEVLSRCW